MKRVLMWVALPAAFCLALAARADAMPPFAQAYGVQCSVCHTQIPTLNAYGRYVQRTAYASLDPHVLRRSIPVWVGEQATDATGDKLRLGNEAIHAAGVASENWSYHVQQWIQSGDQPGGVDTAWVAYNNLFHRDGHLFVGKVEAPAPSPFSQWIDSSPFADPELTVGEHVYELDANRWGTRLNYVHGSLDAEVAYLGSSGDPNTATDFTPDTEKTVQWKLAHADPAQPLEYGLYGSRGSFTLAEGAVDQYHTVAGYVQRDPVGAMPGIFVDHQLANDSNPDDSFNAASSNATSIELYEPVLGHGLLGVRKSFTNDGMGNQSQTGNVDFAYDLAKYLHLYVEDAMTQGGTPTWNYMLWWTTPISSVK